MFIYAIGTQTHQKIGFSSDVEQRLRNLQTANSEKLCVHHKVEVPKKRARILERKIHKEMSYKRVKGEWFDMSPKDAKNILEFMKIRWLDDTLLD